MIVHTIVVTDKNVRIGYIENEQTYPQACTLKSGEYARPELYRAMNGIGEAMAKLDAAKDCNVDVQKVTAKFTQDNHIANFAITGTLEGDDGLNLKFTTEKISIAFDKEMTKNVMSALMEAELFVKGKRAQTELQFEGGEE